MSFVEAPDQYAAPPVETWTMPSDSASAKPRRAAFRVWEEVTLTAGNAKPPVFARSIISEEISGVAMGMLTPRRKQWLLHGYLHPSHECPGAEYVKPGPGNVPGPGTTVILTVYWRPRRGAPRCGYPPAMLIAKRTFMLPTPVTSS